MSFHTFNIASYKQYYHIVSMQESGKINSTYITNFSV